MDWIALSAMGSLAASMFALGVLLGRKR